MIAYEVKDMTCGHCVSTITKALKATDKNAKVTVDLARHLVMIEPTEADADALREAIVEAGYTPVQSEPVATEAAPQRGSCCGHCH